MSSLGKGIDDDESEPAADFFSCLLMGKKHLLKVTTVINIVGIAASRHTTHAYPG